MGLFSLSDKFASLGATAVDNQFLLEYMPNASGEAVKVYLYGLLACTSQMQDMSVDQMAHDLGLSREDVLGAYRHWERVGLVERTGDNPLSFRYIPVNQSVFMGNTAPRDFEYERFTESVYAVFGNDYRIHGQRILQFYEWVVDLGLPQEVVLMLIRHMISLRGKNFSYASANKLAEDLSREHVRTIEDAELALTRDREVRECSRAILRKLGMRREPTEPELNLCQKWMQEWHYAQDAILAACDETTAAGSPSFKYVEGILEKRLKGQEDVGSSAEAYKSEQARQEQRREPLKRVYEALGRGTGSINEGTLNIYWDLRRNCEGPEVIQFAAEQCGKANGKLEDVVRMVNSWQQRGIRTEAEARVYVERFENEKKLLTELGEIWGIRTPAGENNHSLIQKWRTEFHLPDDVIRYAAGIMSVDSRHMPYLDKILTRYDAQNIRTVEAARMDNGQHETARPQTGRNGKVVTESLYDQRENTEPDAQSIPQWLKDRQEEMSKHATGDSSSAAK